MAAPALALTMVHRIGVRGTPTGNLAALERYSVHVDELTLAKHGRLPFGSAQTHFDDLAIHRKLVVRRILQRAVRQHMCVLLGLITDVHFRTPRMNLGYAMHEPAFSMNGRLQRRCNEC